MASESCSYTILTLGPAPYQNHWGLSPPAVSKLKHVKIQYRLPLRIFLQIVTHGDKWRRTKGTGT